jgi:hypothetical protein
MTKENAPKEDVHWFTTNKREGPSNIYGMPVFADGQFIACGRELWDKNEAWFRSLDLSKTPPVECWNHSLERHNMRYSYCRERNSLHQHHDRTIRRGKVGPKSRRVSGLPRLHVVKVTCKKSAA